MSFPDRPLSGCKTDSLGEPKPTAGYLSTLQRERETEVRTAVRFGSIGEWRRMVCALA